jgi:hypothetical protein
MFNFLLKFGEVDLAFFFHMKKIMCMSKLLDINFLPSYLSYFYQIIVIWEISATFIYFWDFEIC